MCLTKCSNHFSKKFPTGPTFHGPRKNLSIKKRPIASNLRVPGSVGNRSVIQIFDGKNIFLGGLKFSHGSAWVFSGQQIQGSAAVSCRWAGILRVILAGGDFDDWQLGGHDFDWRN